MDYHSDATPQSGMFFKNQPVAKVNVFDIRDDENISKPDHCCHAGSD